MSSKGRKAEEDDDESSEEEEQLGDLTQIKPGFMEECKMVSAMIRGVKGQGREEWSCQALLTSS